MPERYHVGKEFDLLNMDFKGPQFNFNAITWGKNHVASTTFHLQFLWGNP